MQVKRSSTTREQSDRLPVPPEEKSSTLRAPRPKDVHAVKEVHVFDNLGFDRSPDLRRQRAPNSSSEQLQQQLEAQLRREQLKQSSSGGSYSRMQRSSVSDSSDCSAEEKLRRSPPTQTQSLSEESSTGGSRRATRDSFTGGFDDSDSEASGAGEPPSPAPPPFAASNPYVRVPPTVMTHLQSSQQGMRQNIALIA